tara:strand:+ start:886 stop:1125 length:240 start_codon:yes stop_codon:yes gene_type:complete
MAKDKAVVAPRLPHQASTEELACRMLGRGIDTECAHAVLYQMYENGTLESFCTQKGVSDRRIIAWVLSCAEENESLPTA